MYYKDLTPRLKIKVKLAEALERQAEDNYHLSFDLREKAEQLWAEVEAGAQELRQAELRAAGIEL